MDKERIPNEKWETFLEVLRQVARDPGVAPDMQEAKGLIAKINKRARKENRRAIREQAVAHDEMIKESSQRCQMEQIEDKARLALDSVELESVKRKLLKPQRCYVCKEKYTEVDPFYHLLCPECAKTNHYWRTKEVDFSGMTALVTGARRKIGFELCLRSLRSGARVIATTRFPKDAAHQYAKQHDFDEWKDRLELHALDLRYLPSVMAFADHVLASHASLDCIFNNAAQTLKRPPGYEQGLLLAESKLPRLDCVHSEISLKALESAQSEMGLSESLIAYDFDNEPVDLALTNSWKHTIEEVPVMELLETHLITSFAPFILNSQLKSLLIAKQSPSFIVNDTAMEGQFARESKTERHPHTNMAKASMNMMTRTCAQGYAREGIYMNSVDTGWITNENPREQKLNQRKRGFVPPLDCVDGAARVIAPVIDGWEGNLAYGKFYKDYQEHAW